MNKGLLYRCFVITIMLLTVSAVYPASAEIYTATNTDDSGTGSLLWALSELDFWDIDNSEIHFNIPGPGVHTITLLSPVYPIHTKGAIIDGYTQPGASPNTLVNGNNAVLLIELNGASAGAGVSGLSVSDLNVTIRGLVINGFAQYGIRQFGSSTGLNVTGNFIGTNPSGTAAGPGNSLAGVLLNAYAGARD